MAGGQARGYAPYPEPSGPAWPAAGTGGPTSAGPVARRPPAPQRPLSVQGGGEGGNRAMEQQVWFFILDLFSDFQPELIYNPFSLHCTVFE